MELKRVGIEKAGSFLRQLFSSLGMDEDGTRVMRDVLISTTLSGRGHHDISFVPMLAELLRSGKASARPRMRVISASGGIESWDGDDGLGPVCCTKAMERAMELAGTHGIGICAMRHTNHFLAAAPYVGMAAEKGYIGIILAKGGVSMGLPGESRPCMSALPMGFAYPTQADPVIFDACMAYASMGKLHKMQSEGRETPAWWGAAPDGTPTSSPAKMLEGIRYPIGWHKGFALAMLGEVLTGVIADGCVLDQAETEDGSPNWSSHTAIVIKAGSLVGEERFKVRAGLVGELAKARTEHLHIPGEGMLFERRKTIQRGYFELDEELVRKLDSLAEQAGISGIS